MKKKFWVTVLILSLLGNVSTSMAFAEDSVSAIQTTEQLKAVIAEHLEDGKMTEHEKLMILENAEEAAVEGLIMEKLETATELLNEPASKDIKSLPEGRNFIQYEIDLNDGCNLNIELWDRSEDYDHRIGLMSTSGNSSPWKEYGNRYFTAKATVSCGSYSVTISLENHYTLSSGGITERYGKPDITPSDKNVVKQYGDAKISKSTASAIGSSAGIYCSYSFKKGTGTLQQYRMNTTVKYLAHNKTTKKIQVGQSWDLVKQ